MATSSYKTFLMHKASGGTTYSKLVDIKDYPDIYGEPELLETTTLSDGRVTNIFGIQQSDSFTFTLNYDHAVFATIQSMEGEEHDFALWMGGTVAAGVATPTGSEGKYEFTGIPSIYINGKGVNEVREMTLSIAVSSDIVDATA